MNPLIKSVKFDLSGILSSIGSGMTSLSLLGLSMGTVILANPTSAQAEFLPIMSKNCTPRGNGNYICTFEKGKRPGPQAYRSYDGQVKRVGNGWLPHGYGIVVYESDDRYEGDMRDGLAHGKGMYLFANNDRYEGDVRDEKPEGRGTFTLGNGDRYTGQVFDGHPHGLGSYYFASTNGTYEGQFFLGQIKGTGSYSTASAVCDGLFFSSKLSGRGTCNYRGNSPMMTYTGEWRGGIPHGRGTMIYSNGKRFSGEFRSGKEFSPGKTAN
jgi:hypothetical protein